MILATGHLVYLGATTFDLRRIDSLMPPLDDAPVLYRPGVLPGWTSSLIGRVEAVVFDRYGVVTADLAVNDDAWQALTGNEPGRHARATFDIGAATWGTDGDVAVASRARLIAVYLAPVPAVPPGDIDREQLWPSDTLFTKVDR